MDEQFSQANWVLGMRAAPERAVDDRERALERVARCLNEAVDGGDRSEILAQFDLGIKVWNKGKHWHAGFVAARHAFDAIARWDDFDAAPYALTVARFAHNYANELAQARLFEAAEEFYNEALDLFESHGDSLGEMVTLHQLGRARQARGNYPEAECAYRDSLKIARERGDLYRVGLNLFQLGQVAHLKCELDESKNLYLQVFALDEDIPSAPLMTGACHQLGLIAQARGEYSEARRWFEEATHRAERASYLAGEADALHQLGMIAQAEGEIAKAEKMYHASLELASKLNNPTASVPTLYQLALCACARKDFAEAEKFCNECMALVQAQGDLDAIKRVKQLLLSVLQHEHRL